MNTPAHKPELWQFRWTNPSGEPQPASALEWKRVEPLWNQTVEQKCEELLAYRYMGKPMYEVRALYTAPPAAPDSKSDPVIWNYFVSVASTLIKAADDAAVENDYMLDSDDCIKVLRGEWTGFDKEQP